MDSDAEGTTGDGIAVRLLWPADPVTNAGSPLGAVPTVEDEVSSAAFMADAPDVPLRSGSPERLKERLPESEERLGDRVMERLGALREDVDHNLATVRSELALLREAVDDTDGLQALRAIVAELAEVRRLLDGSTTLPTVGPLLEQVIGLREEVSGMRDEMASLRRRIALRVAPGTSVLGEPPPQQVDRPAEGSPGKARRARR